MLIIKSTSALNASINPALLIEVKLAIDFCKCFLWGKVRAFNTCVKVYKFDTTQNATNIAHDVNMALFVVSVKMSFNSLKKKKNIKIFYNQKHNYRCDSN